MVMLAMSACIPGLAPRHGTSTAWQSAVFYVSLYVVALGTGGSIFGAIFSFIFSVFFLFASSYQMIPSICGILGCLLEA